MKTIFTISLILSTSILFAGENESGWSYFPEENIKVSTDKKIIKVEADACIEAAKNTPQNLMTFIPYWRGNHSEPDIDTILLHNQNTPIWKIIQLNSDITIKSVSVFLNPIKYIIRGHLELNTSVDHGADLPELRYCVMDSMGQANVFYQKPYYQ